MFPPPRHSQMAVGSAGLPKQPASLKSRREADRGEGSPGRRDPRRKHQAAAREDKPGRRFLIRAFRRGTFERGGRAETRPGWRRP